MNQKLNTKQLTLCGLMGGLSAALMFFRFPLPFMPPFMDFDFSGLVEIIGGFTMGPFAALAIITHGINIRKFNGKDTGELQNFMLSCAYVLPAVFIYSTRKTKLRAVIGMSAGTVICAVAAVFTNLYIIIPFYTSFMGIGMDDILSMCRAVNPLLSTELSLALLGIIPFNLIKNGVLSVLAFAVYKKISRHIKQFVSCQGGQSQPSRQPAAVRIKNSDEGSQKGSTEHPNS